MYTCCMQKKMTTFVNPFRAELVSIFRRLISCDASLCLSTNYTFYFKTVCSTYNNVTRACVCGFEHEYFDYISKSGTVDRNVFEKICTSLEQGKCPHVEENEDENAIATVGVTVLRIAVVTNNMKMFDQILTDFAYSEMAETFLFQLTFLHIAVIRKNDAIAEALSKRKSKPRLSQNKIYGNFPLISREVDHCNEILLYPNTTLWTLCIKGNLVETAKILLAGQHYSDLINIVLFDAIRFGNMEITEMLLRYFVMNFAHNKVLGPKAAYTAYLSAVISNRHEFVVLISEYFKLSDTPLPSPLLLSPNPSLGIIAANLGFDDCEKALAEINQAAVCDKLQDQSAVSPYFSLISKNEIISDEVRAEMVRRFSACNHDINLRDKDGRTVLYYALIAGTSYFKTTKALLECGADGDSIDEHENSSLYVLFKHSCHQYSTFHKLKLLLYSNISLEKVPFALPLALDIDLKNYLSRSVNPWFKGTLHLEILGDFGNGPEPDSHISYLVPLLLDAGAKPQSIAYSDIEMARPCAFLHKLLEDSKDFKPRTLKLLSRDTLRRHFVGKQIHTFVKLKGLPASMREFILLEKFIA